MKMRYKFFIFLVIPFILASCVTHQEVKVADKAPYKLQSKDVSRNLYIDYLGLQQKLKLDGKNTDQLGYYEKLFSTCSAGNGFSSNSNCQLMYFVVIHFKLSCRYSEGTISTPLEKSDIFDLHGRYVQWSLSSAKGELQLNENGQAKLVGIFKKSPRFARLKLGVDNDNLYTRAGEIKSVITPQSWCN